MMASAPKGAGQGLVRPADEDFVLDDYIFYNVNHASSQYGDRMEKAFGLMDIDQTAWRVLSLLSHDENSRLSDIARRGMIKVPTLSRRIDRMVEEGLVLREVGKDDRRTVRVSLTAKGQAELRRARQASTDIFDAATAGIPAQDIWTAVAVLQRIRRNLDGEETG
ncbi:MAG: MarR family winged helix-turn-helix transcriptional regulator [Novosphingobium sp.]